MLIMNVGTYGFYLFLDLKGIFISEILSAFQMLFKVVLSNPSIGMARAHSPLVSPGNWDRCRDLKCHDSKTVLWMSADTNK